MSEIPYYLKQNVFSDQGLIDIYNTENMPLANYNGNTEDARSVWENMSNTVSEATEGVFDTVSGAFTGVVNVGQNIVGGISEGIENAVWNGVKILALVLGGVLLLIWVAGKSGAIGQSAGLVGAIYGR